MPESEQERAEQLDASLARLRAGEEIAADDELRDLLALAERLKRGLPEDLPDPAFRARLGRELTGEPAEAPIIPLESAPRHWYTDWRVGALAAVLVLLLVGGLIVVLLNRTGPVTPARATVVSAFGPPPKNNPTAMADSTKVVANTNVLPAVDAAHVVQVQLGQGGGPEPATPEPASAGPTFTLNTTLPQLPATEHSWLLASPPSPSTFVQNELARLGVTGTVRQETEGDDPVVVGLDATGFSVVRWRPQDAFFSYNRSPNAPTPPPARADADPKETARAWLQEIGFDLTTIQYDADLRADSTSGLRIVEFRPTNLPQGALDPGLGAVVWVGSDGAIRQASGFWLSLVESAEVPLQPVETAWQAVQGGEGLIPSFGPPPIFKAIAVKSVQLTYLLTRADASNYLLQPVVAFSGQGQTAVGPADVTVYVAAAAR